MLRSQRVATDSLQNLEQATQRDADFQQRYATLVNRLPIMLREHGLVASLGFLLGKSGNDDQSPEALLLRHLSVQLGFENAEALHQQARTANTSKYRHLNRRLQEVLVWYKRLAESMLKTGEENRNAD